MALNSGRRLLQAGAYSDLSVDCAEGGDYLRPGACSSREEDTIYP